MKTLLTRFTWQVILGAAPYLVSACTGPQQGKDGFPLLDSTSWLPGLSLSASAIRDTIRRGEALEIAYFVRNRGPASEFRHDPLFVQIAVMGPSGAVLKPMQLDEAPALGSRPELVIPSGGLLGQVVNLMCGSWLYSASQNSHCAYRYEFEHLGDYRIIVRYAPVPPPDVAPYAPRWPTLNADTVQVTVAEK
jgi:hypothetical protein